MLCHTPSEYPNFSSYGNKVGDFDRPNTTVFERSWYTKVLSDYLLLLV